METLVAKIKANQNRFRKQPRGPFASCFTVKASILIKLIIVKSINRLCCMFSKNKHAEDKRSNCYFYICFL